MGMYIFVSEQDRINKRQVQDDYVNEEFQEALKYCPSLMIEQIKQVVKKGWFRKETIDFFQIYHESPAHNGTAYQARYQHSGSGQRNVVIAYLHGIINANLHKNKNDEKNIV